MTRGDTLKLMAVLKTAYPAYYRGMRRGEAEKIVGLWTEMLAPYPLELCLVATKRLIAESKFTPTIAEIISRIREFVEREDDSAESAWKLLRRAAERSTVMSSTEYDALPSEVREFAGGRRGLASLGNLDETTLDTVTRGQFLKTYPAMRRRRETRESIAASPVLRGLVESLAGQNPALSPGGRGKPGLRRLGAAPPVGADGDPPESGVTDADAPTSEQVKALIAGLFNGSAGSAYVPPDADEWEQRRREQLDKLRQVSEGGNPQ